MNDNKRKLYDALSNDYDMGTYEQFRKDLEDKDKRRKLYDATSDAYDFGDYDQFEAQLGYGQSQSAPSAEEINSGSAGPVMPKPAMENRNWEVQMGNGHSRATVEKPEPVDVPIPQRPEGQEPSDDGTAAPSGDVRLYLEYANRQQVANLSRDISSRLDEAQTKSRDIYMKEQEDARKGGFLSTLAHAIAASGHNPEGRSGGMSDAQQRTLQGANSELQSEISKLEAAKKAISNAEEIIAEADKSVQEGKFPRFVKGVARGFGDKLFDVNTWDMGVSDTKNSIELLKALRKYDEGNPLSESEQMLLDAKSVELATNAYFGSYIGRGYKAGAVTAQSLPFMLEMAVNPASTLGESTQSMLARYALSRFAKKGATRAAQKFATKAAGAAGRALGDIAGSAVMAGTSGAVRVAGDAIDRYAGDIETDMDGQGQTVFAGHDTESLGNSIAKAFASTAIENHSEMLGEYFAPALGIVSKLGRKGMEKFGLKKVVDFVDDVSATDAAKLIADFQKRTKWHGTIGEYAEEVAGNIENAILVGDNTLDASDDTGVFNLDQNIDTFLGVALMGGVFSAVRTAMWRTPKYRARMEMEKARDEARTKYGSEAWQEIEDRMAEAGDSGMSAVLSTVIAGENSPEKAKALLDYAKIIKKYEGMLAGDEKRREIASPEATDLETSYENGYTLSTPQEVHDAKLMFEYQEAMLQKALGTSDIDIDTIMLGNEMGTLTDEQKSVAMDYLNAKATFDGVIDRVRDDIDSRISSVENAIDASTNRDTGMLQPASLVDDRPVHIISGIIRLTPDGTMVDTRNSENFIIVRDDRTGRMETISPSDINRLENEIDPAMEKQAARQQIQDVYGSREADSIDGVLAFNPGDTYTLTNEQGQSFPVQIVANEQGVTDNGDGTVNVILNNDIDTQTGQPRITQMPKEQIQEMAEATNLSRLQQYEQQKIARAAEQAETDATGRTPENPFRINDKITLSDAETGNMENGVVGSELTDDGKYEVVVEKQDGSQSILYLSPSELEQLGAKLEQPEAVEERSAPVLEQNQPVLEQKTDKAEQESAMSRIPLDRDGVPQFEQAQPSDTWEALLELNSGNAVEAEDTARQMYENASKNLDKAQKTKPKSGTSVMEIQRNKAERNGQIDELRKSVDFWGKVLSFPEAVRKSASAAAAAEVRQKEDAKREAVRQAKENLAKGRKLMQQKGTYYKDDAKLGDYLDFHDYALRMIANGRVKFVWKNDADNNSIKGLGGHLGLEDSESERKALFSLLANQDKGGLRPDDAAEQLSEEYNSSLGAEVISSSEALDVILDIIRTYGGKTRDMMNAAIDAHAMAGMDERGHDEDNKSSEDKDNSKIAEGQESLPADAPLSNEMNEFGVPFIESSDGTTVFGVLTDDSGLSPAPIKLSLGENATDKNGTNHGYGLLHIEAGHGDQIRAAGYDSIEKFVEDVARNYDTIREGGIVANNQTYLLELSDEHNNTLFIQLSRDGSYWNINSAGIFKKKYSRRKPEVFTRPALKTETDTDSGRVDSSRFNGATAPAGNSHQTSEGKDTNISEESNTGSEKSVAEQITEQREVVNTEPTEAQKEAGNYRMGHVKIDGMDVTIENPKGSIRRGTDADGKEWQSEMHHDYGYIRGTKAVDNDHIDIFLSDNPETGNVFVVDQVNPKTGEFDESKVMYGFASEQEARDAYLSNYEKGWKGLGKITEVTREEFKKWIDSSTRKTKPFSEYASVKAAEAQKEKGTSTQVSDSSKNNTSDKASERGFILMDDFIESALQEAYENRTDKSLSRDDWNEEDEAIDAENKANDDYYQYIESLSNSGELQKMYDASSIGEQIKMRKSIGEAGHEFKDLIDTTKAADARKEAREKKKKEEYRLKMKTLGIDIEDDDVQPSTKKPETQKEKPVQGLEGYSRDEIKNIVTEHINDVMRDYDIDAEIIGMDIHGSRNRHDARPDSDLDVVVEYSGDIREDDMFNALNGEEDALSIEGIKVDINPIRKEETGDLQDYMRQSEEYDKEKSEHAKQKGSSAASEIKNNKSEKIEDYGEQISGARKDMLRDLAKTIQNTSLESLISLPFSKAFKKPNLRKAVEEGALRDKDARFAQAAIAAFLSTKKPVAGTKDERRRQRWGEKTNVEKWAEKAYTGIKILQELFDADERVRDKVIEAAVADKYVGVAEAKAQQQRIGELNYREFNGTSYPLNLIALYNEVFDRLGYPAGQDTKIPVGRIVCDSTFDSYSLRGTNGENWLYSSRSLKSFEDVVDELVYLIKVANADETADHPIENFKIRGINPKVETTGYRVLAAKNLTTAITRGNRFAVDEIFPTREAALKRIEELKATGLECSEPLEKRETVGYEKYQISFAHPITREFIPLEKEYDSKEEAIAAPEAEHEELNRLANEAIAAATRKSGESVEKSYFHITHYYDKGSDGKYHWYYGVALDDKYGPKKTAFNTMPFFLAERLNSREEAQKQIDANKERWESLVKDVVRQRSNFVYFSGDNDTRKGEDYRNGKDVTAEEFANKFGFRGVQFGNWANQADRQAALNNAYDSFMDMSKIIGVSPKAMSLNGELGVAFGSRGSGAASAHYEPGEVVINLTKTRGAGSLAHEWWHALDNYFSRAANVKLGYVTSDKSLPMREEMRKAFNDLVDDVEKSDYHTRSMDRGSGYWGTRVEETARLFAEWIADEMAKRGELNNFLAGRNDSEDSYARMGYVFYRAIQKLQPEGEMMTFEEFRKTPMALKGFSYPTRAELETLGKDVRNIFGVVQERTDETTGDVALFQMVDKILSDNSPENRLAYEAVSQMLSNAGIPVEFLSDQAMREMAINATMLDTALPEDESSFKGTVISSTDGAKILRNLDNAIDDYQNVGDKGTKTFLGDLASALGSSDKDKSSQYATFETKNGQVVTIRVSNHNATVSNFDNAGESNGISIVISRKPNEGMTNDGDAHIVEFFYPDKALNKADGKPLVEILKSVKQSLYSGEYKDTTGLAQREEVNAKESVEFLREPDGTVYGATVGGKIYLNRERLNPNTPIHEYTHLWFSALEKANPELYKRGVELMRQLPIWEEVKTDPNYANLSGDDAIASECLSRLVGDKGAEKLTELAKKAMVRGDIIGTANRISLIEEFKDWLKKFWTWVRDSFAPWTKEEASRVSVDDIQNMVLSDLAKGVNPLANAREESELKKTNDKFNEQLETLTEKNADSVVLSLGRPSDMLQSAGVKNKPMKLYGNKVMKKMRKHGFALEDLRDLPRAVADPIAVFNNYGEDGNRSILTELRTQQGNFLVSVNIGKDADIDFNIVRSVFGKGDENVVDWINKGLATYINKEKALSFLSHQSAPIAATAANAELLSAANIVKEFENPSGKERKPEFQFIGEKGAAHMDKVEEATIRLDNLSIARQMEDADKDAKTIKLATGWERGADGKWRYEISDANIKDTIDLGKGISEKRFEEDMLWNSGRLGNVIEAPEIFKAYPQLKDVHIETDSIVNDMPSNGEYNANSNRITIHADRLKYLNSILNHEIQHAIQHIEGFATGGTPEHLEKEFNAARSEWRARAYAHELEETAKELGGEYNLAEVENALGKEYKELGMEALLPDKETRIKGANYFARGYADRSMDEAIKRFRLDEFTRSDFNSYDEYRHLAGEVEARNVSARLGMTLDERRRTLALETEDVSREDQIILNDALNGDSHYEEEPEIDRIVREAKENGTYMKAPNGKPTNLDERQWAQVRTGAFKKWFGDWEKAAEESPSASKTNSSKIVDENGEPKVVYHGSPYRFFRFDKARLGQSTGADSAKEGFFFTDNKDLAELFSRYSLEKLPVSDVEQLVKDRLRNMSRKELNDAYEAYRNDSPDYQDYADEAGSPSDREYLEISGFLRDGISEDDAKRNYVQDSIENKIEGGYFSDMEEIEEELSSIGIEFGNNEQVFLNIKSPITDDIERDYFHNGEDVSPMTPVLQEAKRMGHDGVVFTGIVENGQKGAANQYVAFEPGQIKSATDNVGTFDGEQDDIRYRDSGQTDAEYMSAIESGDMRKAGRMVEAAFRKAFPGSKVKNVVYHGVAVSEDGRQFPYNSIREGHFTDDEGFAEYYAGSDGYVYKVFLDIESPLEQDFRGQNSDFARDAEGNDVSTRTFARRAKESNGRYDGAIISNVDEYGDGIEADGAGNYDGSVTDYIPVSADQIYSAEPVVYDNNGQVVPLSKRFVAGNPDIRYKQDGAVNGSRTSQDVETAAARLAESLGEKVRIVRDVNEIENLNKKVQENQRRSKGWFNTGTGEIVVVLPNATGIEDVQATILHEAVGHKGLRELVGDDRFDDFLDKVYAAATKATRLEIVGLARRNHWDFRLATEEYIAGLAEKGFSGRENRTLFGKIKDFFLDMLSMAKIALGFNIGDNELRYMLWRTYQMRTSRGILAKANDMAVQQELKVGNFREDQLRGRNGFTENDIAEMETPILESKGTFKNLNEAEKWAKEYLQGKSEINEYTGEVISVSGRSISEMLNPKSTQKVNEIVHLAALKSVLDFIKTGIPAETHNDTHGRGYDVMRLYNAISINGEVYRVKSTIKRLNIGDRFYTYEMQEMELSERKPNIGEGKEINSQDPNNSERSISAKSMGGTQSTAFGLDSTDISRPQTHAMSDGVINAISGANLLKGVKKTNSDEEILSGDDSRLRFRTSGNGESSNTARDIYEEKTRVIDRNGRKSDTANLMRRLKEAYVDSMQSLKYLQDAISEETGKPVEDFENAYLAENSMSSKNKAQTDIYLNRFFNPIKDAIRDLQKEGAEYGDIVRYLMAKHGLERNEVFSKRDAEKDGGVWDGSVRRDYSGLTELTRRDTDTVAPRIDEITSRAEDIVRKFEMDHDTDVLWEKINDATKDTLRTSYITGMLTKDNYEMVRSMFRYYIPLRGWSENTASAVYDYLSDARPKTSSIVKAATGRTTISDDPIATIAYMGQSAIIQGNRNLMKQKLLNLALNHKTGLLTVSRQWEVLDPVTGMWTPRDPDIPADAAPEQVADIVSDFEKDMKEAEKKGVARLSRGKLDTGKHLTAYEGQEHIIKVKRGGIDYSIYLNGNPRAAQAVNGMTNPDAVDSWLIRKARVIKNFMARMFTSQNPAFIISNLSRDVIFAGTAVYAKEDAKYAARYAKNITVALAKGQLIGLIHRFETDRLDNSKDLDRYFGEFIRNGGETGFTQLNTVDDFKRDIDRFAREMKQGQVMKVSTKVWNGIWDGIEYMNRCAEDATRFSVYMTSRQMGRSVERSISDAKEITVNFNRKGSGGFGARLMNFAYIFFNAAVQSLANAGKIMYEHPMKALAALGAFSAAGFMAPLLAQAIISAFGGDDDAYWDLPEWVRRNNFVFYIPWSDNKFLIIPISQELRPFYAMGEIAMSVLMGKEEVLDGLKSAAGSFMDLLPIDFMGNGGNLAISLTPTVAQPFAQLVANTDYFGSPIYRRNDYNKLDPAWTKAYKGTSPMLVNASKWLNEVTGGDDVKRGWIDPINNPAVIEHLFESYLGGTGKTINRAAKTFSMIWNPDMRDIRNVPIASTFIQESDDERVAGNQLNREYFKLMDEFKETSHTVSGYKKKARMGSMEYADKLNEFMETPDFERYSKARGYANTISKLRQALKRAQESGEDVMVEENLQQILHDLKRQMVEELKEQ